MKYAEDGLMKPMQCLWVAGVSFYLLYGYQDCKFRMAVAISSASELSISIWTHEPGLTHLLLVDLQGWKSVRDFRDLIVVVNLSLNTPIGLLRSFPFWLVQFQPQVKSTPMICFSAAEVL